MNHPPSPEHGVPLREAAGVWARIALMSFGGPAGQIAVMHRILVEEKRWIGEERFLHALNFCMLLPGPEAQQLATYVGWLMHRTRGALLAGGLFILPGLVAIMALSWIYVLWGSSGPVSALLFGVKAAVVAIVFQAVARIGSRALGNGARLAVAAAAFIALFLFGVPFPLIVLAAGLVGYLAGRSGRSGFTGPVAHGPSAGRARFDDEQSLLGTGMPAHARPERTRTLRLAAAFLLLWLLPVGLLALLAPASVFADIAAFFSLMAMVTFGGAYAVLAYVAQAAVETYGWLSPAEMLDGLGLAESTPGPLIMVTQFVGFLGAYRDPGGLPPLAAATLGGLLTTWVTFLPCFLWILIGAPFIERLRGNRALAGALAAITAAVVGVILNLGLWFALHFLFRVVDQRTLGPLRLDVPDWSSLDPAALLLTLAAILLLFGTRIGMLPLLGLAAVAGLVLHGIIGL